MSNGKMMVSLFDYSGIMAIPWLNAGYECWIVDNRHPVAYDKGRITKEGNLIKLNINLMNQWLPPFEREDIAFVSAFPPCDHLAVSGARWFRGKGLRMLAEAAQLFATCAEFCEWAQAPYFIENPVGTMSTYWRKPDHYFHPFHYSGLNADDNYTKKTCLWTGGGFVMPKECKDKSLGTPDNRMHEYGPSPDRSDIRSRTPLGFAEAVFNANNTSNSALSCPIGTYVLRNSQVEFKT